MIRPAVRSSLDHVRSSMPPTHRVFSVLSARGLPHRFFSVLGSDSADGADHMGYREAMKRHVEMWGRWEKRYPTSTSSDLGECKHIDFKKDFPHLWDLKERIEDDLLDWHSKGVTNIHAMEGLQELLKYCTDLKDSCEKGKVSSCLALVLIDAMAAGIKGKNCAILLHHLHDAIGAYRQDYKNWKKAFVATDRNQDGFIDMDEFKTMLQVLGMNVDDDMVEQLFHAVDIDNDGRIGPAEFEKVLWDGGLLISSFVEGSDAVKAFARVIKG